mmetsp:Transcript_20350/g.65065  ORF Transcript_20350/g.65065 Transcript_20350/m.65065 type:complete len:352 (+) Transcript_20350:337-1392(+)
MSDADCAHALLLRVLSWNVLANAYTDGQVAPSPSCLDWKRRSAQIFKRIGEARADILFFQEMDMYDRYFDPALASLGLEGLYKSRTRRKPDGCAVYWNPDKWRLERFHSVDFNDFAVADAAEHGGTPEDYARDNVALIVELHPEGETGLQPLVAATGHLYWSPAYDEVKQAQAKRLVRAIDEFNKGGLPVVFGGDMNSVPGSKVYSILQGLSPEGEGAPRFRSAYSSYQSIHGSQFEADESTGSDEGDDGSLVHDGGREVHRRAARAAGEPEFTNRTNRFEGTLDYIMFEPAWFALKSLSKLPTAAELEPLGCVLGYDCPSDHTMLVADLQMRARSVAEDGVCTAPQAEEG